MNAKARKFKEDLRELDDYKKELKKLNLPKEEYDRRLSKKAKELDL